LFSLVGIFKLLLATGALERAGADSLCDERAPARMTAAPATAEAATAATFPIPVAIFEPVERAALGFVEVFARTGEETLALPFAAADFAFATGFPFGAAFFAGAALRFAAGAGRFALAGFAIFFGLALDFAIGLGVRSEFRSRRAKEANRGNEIFQNG
jgi:hypothetical protein